MPQRPFRQVDVFTREAFRGNPVAVVLDADGLTDEQMRRVANWTNLSETTFVLPPTQPGADYRLRIFTPQTELPFAGHPTLGTAHALIEAGRITPQAGRLVQECATGLIQLTVTTQPGASPLIDFVLPEPGFTPLSDADVAALAEALGAPVLTDPAPQHVRVGPVWTVVQLPSAQAVLALRPDFARLARLSGQDATTGVAVFGVWPQGASPGPAAIEVRAFAPADGINEDPVCGSGNGAVAAFIRATGQTPAVGRQYLATQGAVVGRSGEIHIAFEGDSVIRVGGQSLTCIEGQVTL
ncbi:PhzF family phenazine biosynthesis protein [Amphibiibacter pelophylacis]|uniref:PhzF family phenazine biosynthesis protein n=1 Tax=Amphibiibacter pelophylacis TaxID=1799477 RepID=A0ACC6P4V5_9BURK